MRQSDDEDHRQQHFDAQPFYDCRDVAGLLRHAIARANHLRHVVDRGAAQEDAGLLVASPSAATMIG
jgi:hypothetical protein